MLIIFCQKPYDQAESKYKLQQIHIKAGQIMIHAVRVNTLRKWKQTVFYQLSHFVVRKSDNEGLSLTGFPPATVVFQYILTKPDNSQNINTNN